jgi:hypothetical protein
MAVPGKFETAYEVFCARCRKKQTIRARSSAWTGDLRTTLACTTPGCRNVFEDWKKKDRSTKGAISIMPPVSLLTLPGGDPVVLEEYECSEAEAGRFCELFREVLQQIPAAASDAILAHWQTGSGSPHVWLLKDRKEWGGKGWAASRNEGLSLCVVSTLIGQIPDDWTRTAIAHELGHTLFIAGNEPNHVRPPVTLDSFVNPAPLDPLGSLRPEWLVWRLLEAWGFDQPAFEEWMERNTIDDAAGVRLRDHPQGAAEFEGKCIAARRTCEERLQGMAFPAEFEQYRCR